MKVLLIDAGNTRLKWAVYEPGQISPGPITTGVAITYKHSTLEAQMAALWSELQAQYGKFDKIVMSNVAGEKIANRVGYWVKEAKELTIENVAASPHAYGVRCAYQQPTQLGADRWAALVAARHHIPGASCIIDCGTALTIDVLTAEGVHLGGVIVPGLAMMRNSLVKNTEGISAAEEGAAALFASDTQNAVLAGANAAAAGAVEHVLQRVRDELGVEPTCIVTGGDAERLLKNLSGKFCHEPDWVLKGLARIAHHDESMATLMDYGK